AQDEFELARQSWNEGLNSINHSKSEDRYEAASLTLTKVAQEGHLKFVRQLIDESDLEEPLFPLARALDYLLTGDESLVEKLSPEVRSIVEEVVSKLQETTDRAGRSTTKSSARKPRSGSRRRTQKQLR
ncbi:MAG TPA: hypothetical protein VD966_04010, partial [Pyrinomonadaceae bacterium]|nr:hypothetical protein [Pyrinomonadaceae bacterium]